MPVETGGAWGGCSPPLQIFANVDFLLIDNDSEKKNSNIKYKLVQIPQKVLVALLLPTSYNA